MVLVVRIVVFCLFLFLGAANCFGQAIEAKEKPVQFFIKADGQGTCQKEFRVMVFALDAYGLIAKDYQGSRETKIGLKEIGGKRQGSAQVLSPAKLEFVNGQAEFLIEDSEAETVEVSLDVAGNTSPFPARINFKEKMLPERLALKVPLRGNIAEPLKIDIFVVDKNGDVVEEEPQKEALLSIEELGVKDSSFKLDPAATIKMAKGRATVRLSDSQEEELLLRLQDKEGILKPDEARILFSVPDKEPPRILELKMDTLAFIEVIFDEDLDDATATDPNNYEVSCHVIQKPRSVELHKNKVILELNDLLRPHDEMYINIRNIRDLSGNNVASGARSPDFSVPHVPLHLELRPSATSIGRNNSITVSLTARCTSGRVPQFINGQFNLQVSEANPDSSARLSSSQIQMQKGVGEFSVSDSAAEKVTLTISDPENVVNPATLELEFT